MLSSGLVFHRKACFAISLTYENHLTSYFDHFFCLNELSFFSCKDSKQFEHPFKNLNKTGKFKTIITLLADFYLKMLNQLHKIIENFEMSLQLNQQFSSSYSILLSLNSCYRCRRNCENAFFGTNFSFKSSERKMDNIGNIKENSENDTLI